MNTTIIHGACHCGNIHYEFERQGAADVIPVRECGCSFCRKHGGAWTSDPAGSLSAQLRDQGSVSRYRFGTGTADFIVCANCGAVPFVVSELDGTAFAVVNVNTFVGAEALVFDRSATDFDGENTADRLERRRRNWIPNVRISGDP